MNVELIDRLVPAAELAGRGLGESAPAGLNFEQMVEQAEVGICITQHGRFQYCNAKFAQIHGYTPQQLTGTEILALVHPDCRQRVAEIVRLRAAGLHHAPYEARWLRRDGSAFDARIYGRTIAYHGEPAHLVTSSDISELVDAHRLSARRAGMLLGNELLCRSGSIEVDMAQRRLHLSAGAQVLSKASTSGSISLRAALRLLPLDDRALVLSKWRRAQLNLPFELRHRMRRADGSELRLLHRGVIEAGEPNGQLRLVAMLQDITEQSEAQAQVERLVNFHPVTGLATQARLLECMISALEVARRDRLPLALLYLRVPELGRIRHALGLSADDAMASTVAERIMAICRSKDTAAHLGAGEYALLLDPTTGSDERTALDMATRLLAALKVPAMVHGTELVMLGQVGIALFPGDSSSAEQLLEHAHAACGAEHGVSFYTEAAGARASRRLRLEAGLRYALERGELSLHYQPQVHLGHGRIVGVEALLRWRTPEFGNVSPAEFVPIAEEAGLIVGIGEWVFRTACEQSVAWVQAGLAPVRIGVNLSPRQLDESDIAQRLQAILLDTGAHPKHLGIEVTESLLTRDLEHVRRTLNELSAIGIEIALDDFGTGYSNIAMLRALPFDVLKIDRSLVHDVTAATEDVSITRAVLMLAQGLKIQVLAEGVETEGQLNLLVSNGCELIQGYIFSKPLPATEIEQMLREGRCLPEHFLRRQAKQRTLLLVDDEENVLSSLRRLLRSEGYQIVVARSGDEGLARLAEHDVDVILSDQRMPNMTGVEFLRRAKELYPDTVRMVLSGYTEIQSITDAVNEGAIYKFLTKPWDDERLRAHLKEAFRRKELSDENLRLAHQVKQANAELGQANARQQQLLARQCEQLGLEERRALNAQEFLEHVPVAVIGMDADGMVAFVNHGARQLMGAGHALVGRSAVEAFPPDWLEACRPQDGVHHLVAWKGQPCLLACAPFQDSSGPRGSLWSITPAAVAGSPAP